jgi:hypothetical protein
MFDECAAERRPNEEHQVSVEVASVRLCTVGAFRHHGVSPPLRAGRPATGQKVLNAFRHHGVSLPGSFASPRLRVACSTPFGITEFRGLLVSPVRQPARCAQRLSASRSFAGQPPHRKIERDQVLNAFRHHGVSRMVITCISTVAIERAQRLSASRSFAVDAGSGLHVRGDVLNAFRHHGVSRAWHPGLKAIRKLITGNHGDFLIFEG